MDIWVDRISAMVVRATGPDERLDTRMDALKGQIDELDESLSVCVGRLCDRMETLDEVLDEVLESLRK